MYTEVKTLPDKVVSYAQHEYTLKLNDEELACVADGLSRLAPTNSLAESLWVQLNRQLNRMRR
jgi:hypothetical protein